MKNLRSLRHTTWDCKYHSVWILKYLKKLLYGHLREYHAEVFRELAFQKESGILEDHLLGTHVHMPLSIPLKYSVT